MKIVTNRLNVLIVLLALALFPLVATAQDAASTNDTPSIMEKAMSNADKMEIVTITGVVSQDQGQFMLENDNESYLLNADVDEALIGKKVIATGVVVENDGKKTLKAESIKALQ